MVPEVLAEIKSLSKKYIKFPYNAQQSVFKSQFYEIAWFPYLTGMVDWTRATEATIHERLHVHQLKKLLLNQQVSDL